jgi:hypothetical protein
MRQLTGEFRVVVVLLSNVPSTAACCRHLLMKQDHRSMNDTFHVSTLIVQQKNVYSERKPRVIKTAVHRRM